MKTINLESEIINDEYTEYVYDTFDIQNREKTISTIEYDLSSLDEFDWNIGVIHGNSGSGKSNILIELGKLPQISFHSSKPLISNFDWLSPEEATKLLTGMGLSSVPTWLRPYKLLSNGEKYRAELAYKISKSTDDIILIDEYTSVVDRDVAKAMSFALQKYVRRIGKKIILASCHYDVMEWLMPDWTCSPQKGGMLERGDWLRQGRPKIKLQVSRTEHDTWKFFKAHHYLSDKVSESFSHLLFTIDNKPVGICVYAPMPSGTLKNAYRFSRIVVTPDFQGLGIGKSITEFTAAILKARGYRMYIKTVNPALGEYMGTSESWKATAKNKKIRTDMITRPERRKWKQIIRSSYCYEYIGKTISGYDHLLLSIKEMREQKLESQMGKFW